MAEQQIEIEGEEPIVIDIGEEEDALTKAQEVEAKPEIVNEGAADLTKQIEAMRAANEQSEARALEAERQALEALAYARQREQESWGQYQSRLDTEGNALTSGLAAAQAEQSNAQKDAALALEQGDYQKHGEAIARISRAATHIATYESSIAQAEQQKQQAAYEARRVQQNAEVQQRQPPQQRQLSEQEILARTLSNPSLMPQEKEWVKNHPEVATNKQLNNELEVAYRGATRLGIVRGTQEYFDHLNTALGLQEEGKPNMASRVSAPVSRGSGGPGAKPQRVTLTERDIEIATSMGIKGEGLKEYARNKAKVGERMKELNGGLIKELNGGVRG